MSDREIFIKQIPFQCHCCKAKTDHSHVTDDGVILCKACWDELLDDMTEETGDNE